MKQILELFKDPKKQRMILLIGIFILSVLLFKNCGRTKTDDKITQLEQNIESYKDSLKTTKNKVGDLQYEKAVLAADKKNLKDLNSDLDSEVKKQKNKVLYLSKTNIELKDSIESIRNGSGNSSVEVTVNNDGTQDVKWSYDKKYDDYNSRHMEGIAKLSFSDDSTIVKTKITDAGDTLVIEIPLVDEDNVVISIPKDIIRMSFVTGLEQNDEGTLNIFVRSEYPGFAVSKVDGAIIDPHKSDLIKSYFPRKRFVVGPMIGAGVTGDLKLSLFIGAGITYKIFEF